MPYTNNLIIALLYLDKYIEYKITNNIKTYLPSNNYMKISTARVQDIPNLCMLLNILFEQEKEFTPDEKAQIKGLNTIIETPEIGEIFVARDEENVIGMVNLLYTISTALGGKVAILEDMVVDKYARGKGVGSVLIDHVINHAKEKGCKRITLLTDVDNTSAQKFYIKHGFFISDMSILRHRLDYNMS